MDIFDICFYLALIFLIVTGIWVCFHHITQPNEQETGIKGCVVCNCESQYLIKFQVFASPVLSDWTFPGSNSSELKGSPGLEINATWCGGSIQNITDENGISVIPMYRSKKYHVIISNNTSLYETDLYPKDNEYRIFTGGK